MYRLLTAAALLAASAPLPASDDAPFRLVGPRIAKLDWQTRGLCRGDLDGDGRLDLAVVNNDRARIDLLFQRTPDELREAAKTKLATPRWEPIIEDAPFLKESVTTGDFMYDLAILDVNGDGRDDLVYTGKRDRVAVKLQSEDGAWDEKWSYDRETPSGNVGTLEVADIDGDGRDDLVVMTTETILIFRLKGETSDLVRPDTYRVAEENPQSLAARDLNGDGRLDLAYVAESSQRAVRVRYQDAGGDFGPELSLPIPVGSSAWEVLDCGDGPGDLLTIKPTRSELQFTRLADDPAAIGRRSSLSIRNYPVPKSGVDPSLYAVGDLDGDGRADVAVADTNGAAIHVYLQDASGEYRRPVEFPSLQGISSLTVAQLAPGEPATLVVCSQKEGMVGLSAMSEGRLGFPLNISVPGEPLVAAAADIDGDGSSELLVAAKDGRRFNLEILTRSGGSWTSGSPVKLGAIKRDPTGLLAHDLDDDGDTDLVMFIPREATRFLLQDDEGSFAEVGEEDSVRTSQFEGVLPDRFGVGDFTGDGRSEMLVAGKGFVRAYRVQDDGSLAIVDQANARNSLDELTGPVLVDLDGDGRQELCCYHQEEAALQVLQRGDSGLYTYRESLDLAPIGLRETRVTDLGGAAGERLLFLGSDRFWSVPPQRDDREDGRLETFRTELEDVDYTHVALGDLNHDGRMDVLCVDSGEHVVEILTGGCGEPWTSELFFTVFEKNRFNRSNRGGGAQPREVIVGDFTADGRDDFALLIHDRLLLYPQSGADD